MGRGDCPGEPVVAARARRRYNRLKMAPTIESPVFDLSLADLSATTRLARVVADAACPGDVIALRGELGTGKTTFARAFIEWCAAAAGLPAPEVPSPTFTLVQTYELGEVEVWHFDLYRVVAPDEVYEFGIEDALGRAISLIEWPERMGALLPEARLEVALSFGAAPDVRDATLSGDGGWATRIVEIRRHV